MKTNSLRLISFFALGLVITSFGQMTGMGYRRYIYLFQDLPSHIVLLRYVVTWSLRILGVIVGIGILFRRDICRKLGMGLCWFTILTIYLKHPYAGFDHHVRELIRLGIIDLSIFREMGMSYADFVWTAVLMASFLDVLFAAAFILYFRRLSVRKSFH